MKTKTTGYFIYEEFLKLNFKDYFNKIVILAGPRNTGKTTSVLKFSEKYCFSKDARTVYLRMNEEQLKKARTDFNDRFDGRYYCASDFVIYEIKELEVVDKKTGTKDTKRQFGDIVGWFMSVTNYIKYKSGEYKNVKHIILEEFIEDSYLMVGVYDKLANLLTTIIRNKKNVLVTFIGNRDTANNEFMVNLGIEPLKETVDEDVIHKRGNIYYCELGNQYYKDVGNDKSLFAEFAKYSSGASKQLNGGYAKDDTLNVKNFDIWFKNSFKAKYRCVIQGEIVYVGDAIYKNNKVTVAVTPSHYEDLNIPSYALDTLSGLDGDNRILDTKDVQEIWETLYVLIRQKKLMYSSFDAKNILELNLTRYFKLNKIKL